MADDGTEVANGTQSQEETSDIPKYDLYIRVCFIFSWNCYFPSASHSVSCRVFFCSKILSLALENFVGSTRSVLWCRTRYKTSSPCQATYTTV